MKVIRNLTFLLIGGLTLHNCVRNDRQYIYPENDKFSKSNGDPIDSLTFFFPTELNYSDTIIKTNLDTFHLDMYSSKIFASKEKILFNRYLGHDQYRFTWLRAFHLPVFISINKQEDRVWLTVKKLDRDPRFVATIIGNLPQDGKPEQPEQYIPPSRYAELLIDSSKSLTIGDWNSFEKILSTSGYWAMPPSLIDAMPGVDGSEWIIEAHLRNKYWFVGRWSPKDDYKKVGEYLIQLSELDEDAY